LQGTNVRSSENFAALLTVSSWPQAVELHGIRVIENGNVFAELMQTVRVCSLGQITKALFEVGGDGSCLAVLSTSRTRGGDRTARLDMAESDTAFAEIVGRKLQGDLVTGNDANVVLAHLACAVSHEAVAVVERDAIA
jgi:hypothetical protein